MVSQTQRLRQQQRELRGGDLKGLSKTESLRLQQQSLTTGVPKRRLLAIRDYKERMRKAEASPEVREFKNLLVNQNTYLNSLEKRLADAVSQRVVKRAERDIPDLRRSVRRRLSYETKMLDTQIQALQKVIPNVKKVISRIANFRKRAVTAVFVGKPELAIEMINNLRTFANEIQSNSNQYVSAKVSNRGRRLRHNRRVRRRREKRRDALKDLSLAGVDINLLKLGKVSISTEQAERLSTRTQRFLQLDIDKPMTWSVTTTPAPTLISGGINVATGKKISHIDLFRKDKRFIPSDKNIYQKLFDFNNQQWKNMRQEAVNILGVKKDSILSTPKVKSINPPDITTNIKGLLFTGSRYVEDMIGGIPEVVMKAQKDLGIDSFIAGKQSKDSVLTIGDTLFLHTPGKEWVESEWKPTDFYGQGTWVKDTPKFDLTKVTLEGLTEMKKFELVGQIEEERFAKQSEKEARNIINLAVLELEKDALSSISNKIERKRDSLIRLVEIGIITPEVANKQLEKLAKELEVKEQVNLKKKVDKIVERENKKFKDITTAEFKRIRSETNKDIDRRDALGIGVRTAIVTGIFGAALIPIGAVAAPLAFGIGTGVGVSTFIGSGGIKGIKESYAEMPLTTMASLGGSVVGGVVVGGAVFGKTKISARKIHLALDRATNVPKYLGITGKVNIKKIMAKFKITKTEVEGLLLDMESNSNLKLTKITTELKAGKGINELADAKILPKVLAEYLELTTLDGVVVKRYTRGSVIAEQKGKTFAREVLERAVGLVEEGRVDFIGRTLIAKPDIMKGWKSIEARNILEKTKMTGKKKIGDWTFITSETDIYMLGKTTSQARSVQKVLRKEMFDILKTAEAGPGNMLDIFIDTPGKIKKIGSGTDITGSIQLGPKSAIPFGITAFEKVAVPDITKFIKIKGKAKFELEIGSGTGFKKFVKPKKIRDPDGGIKPPWDKSDIMNWRGTHVERIRQLKGFGVKLDYFTEPSKLIHKPSRAFSKAIKKVNQKDVALDALTKPIKKLKQKDIPGTSRSSYAGKGMYEITEGGIMPPSLTSKMSQVRTSARLDFLTKDITRAIIKQDMTRGVFKEAFIGTTTTLSTSSRYSQVMKSDTQLEKLLLGTTTIFKSPQVFGFKERVIQKPKVAQLSLVQQQTLQLTQLTGTTTFVPPRLPPPKISKIIPPFLFPKSFGGRKPKVDKRPYNVFIKGRKIGMNLSKPTAKNFGAYVIDKSIAAQFKIKPTRGKIKQPRFNVPPSYFNLNIGKFRKPRGKKPKRNIYIERKNRRLDTAQEVNQITAARFVASQRKLAGAGRINILGKI